MKRCCKMAIPRLVACVVLYTSLGHFPSSLGVILRTTDKIVWANEFEPIELTCLIESISTNNPRIEWKKIKNGVPSYVYFQNRIAGDLEHRAQLREPANILILNTTRSDTAEYRCEVAAIDDQRDFDEILISLAVRESAECHETMRYFSFGGFQQISDAPFCGDFRHGDRPDTVHLTTCAHITTAQAWTKMVKPVVPRCSVPEAVTVGTSTELRCLENEGFPASQYRWFHNNEELPQDSKNSPKLVNTSYSINPDTGGLKFRRVRKEDAGEYYCQAKNDAGHAQCPSQMMEVYDVDILGIFLKSFGAVTVFFCLAASICHSLKRGCFSKKGHNENNYNWPAQNEGVEYGDADEGHFRHKSSFII